MKKQMMSLYIQPDLKEKLLEKAKNKGLSLNSYIIMILLESVNND